MNLSLTDQLAAVSSHRFALTNLVLKDFRVRYRNMSLGVLWSVLNPLVLLGILTFVFSYIIPSMKQDYYAVFILLGLVAFNFFAMCMNASTGSILESAALVKKVVFPRLIIPISVVLSQCVHFAIQLVLLALFIVLLSVPFAWTYLWLPVIYFVELVFIMGLALICSTLNVYYRDMRYLVESGVTVMFWLTPIFYPFSFVQQNLPKPLYVIYLMNPLTVCIDSSRRVVLGGMQPDWPTFFMAVAVSFITLLVGLLFFARYERNFADNI